MADCLSVGLEHYDHLYELNGGLSIIWFGALLSHHELNGGLSISWFGALLSHQELNNRMSTDLSGAL